MDNSDKLNTETTINDFILVRDNFLTEEDCLKSIDHFHLLKGHGLTYYRDRNERNIREDESVSALEQNALDCVSIPEMTEWMLPFTEKFSETYDYYDKKFSVGIKSAPHFNHSIKIQKTEPTEGYHVWHCESNSRNVRDRVCAWLLYLNDVEEGGETEFLFQNIRVKPKMGTFVLWPGGFTHQHRGNPPISGTKYVMTGWTTW